MLAEFVRAIAEQAVSAARVVPIAVPIQDPCQRLWLIGGEEKRVQLGAPPLEIEVTDVEDFSKLADKHEAVAVFVCDGSSTEEEDEPKVVATLDWENRARIKLQLTWHDLFAQFLGQPGRVFDQRQIVRWLAQDMKGCVEERLVVLFRNVTATATGQATVAAPGKERGTREFAVEAAGELPEYFEVRVPVLTCFPEFVLGLRLGLDVSLPPATVQFGVRPLPGVMHAALDHAMRTVVSLISQSATDKSPWADFILLGKPPEAPRKLDK